MYIVQEYSGCPSFKLAIGIVMLSTDIAKQNNPMDATKLKIDM